MTVILAASVAAPTLPKETVAVESLGGEVVVCGLKLTDRLGIQARMRALNQRAEKAGGDTEDTSMRLVVPELLAAAVVDAESKPLFTAEQWEQHGARHADECIRLFNIAMRLSGFAREDDRKN